ncbi:MAG: hypothetical protein EOO10_02430 [Chitinophagaceae bacterium]|nr:MAG: hypothetical protein EOO10_02430 [Chitinophagaceae bacterium]
MKNRKDLMKICSKREPVHINKVQLSLTKMVENADDIFHYQSISKVFVSKLKISLISSALKAGKSVRVI